jgi:hypothetical protein
MDKYRVCLNSGIQCIAKSCLPSLDIDEQSARLISEVPNAIFRLPGVGFAHELGQENQGG